MADNPMERAIEAFAALDFLVIGLSHVFQHRAWAEFFVLLQRQGRPGAFANGLLSLTVGTLIVAFHNVWTGIPVILTVIGWALVVKSTVTFLHPEWGLRSMARVGPENSRVFIAAGAGMLAVTGALAYALWRG